MMLSQQSQDVCKHASQHKSGIYERIEVLGRILPEIANSPDRNRRRITAAILRIPRGQVSTYGAVARAAGFPRGARLVARTLHRSFGLPWQRVVGAGGAIKLQGESALEQRLRLQAEGVTFRGRRVDMRKHEFDYRGSARKSQPTKKRSRSPRRASKPSR